MGAHPSAPLPGADSPYQGEMSRRDKRGRDAGSAQPRLRGRRRFAVGCHRISAINRRCSRNFDRCYLLAGQVVGAGDPAKHKTPPLVQGRGRSRYHPDHAFAYLSASVSGSTRRAFARPLQTGCGPGLLKGSHCPLLSESAPERSVFQRGFFDIADILPHFLRLST